MEEERKVKRKSVADFESDYALEHALRIKEGQANYKNLLKKGAEDTEYALIATSIDEWKLKTDAKTSYPQELDVEVNRLISLKAYGIVDAEKEPIFERITAFATRTFDVPIALVSLVDLGRQWFLSNRGLGSCTETPRSEAFCGHAIYSTEDILIIPDATKDVRFATNSLVTGPPYIRFYAGSPMKNPSGYNLGTVCIIDTKPRPEGLSLMQKQNLIELSGMAMDALNSRKVDNRRIKQERSKSIACIAHDLLTPLSSMQLNLSLLMEEKELWNSMDMHQKDLISSSLQCSEIIESICQNELESFRGKLKTSKIIEGPSNKLDEGVNIAHLVRILIASIDKIPKLVPISMCVHENVPKIILSDGVKIFRSALNYLTNACKHTKTGSIRLRIFVTNKDGNSVNETGELYRQGDRVVFECVDTGPGVEVEKYPQLFRFWHEKTPNKNDTSSVNHHSEMPHSGLGLQSVANNISSIGGEYGYRPANTEHKLYVSLRPSYSSESFLKIDESNDNDGADSLIGSMTSKEATGSIFWFSVPLVRPQISPIPTLSSVEIPTSQLKLKKRRIEASKDLKAMLNQATNKTETRKHIEPMIAAIKINENPSIDKKNEVQSTMPPPPVPPIRNANEKQTNRRALVIDDSLTIRKSIDRALTKLGYEVQQATNGLEGLKELKNSLFSVTFCDFLMPIMDGLDCVQQYREWERLRRPEFKQYIIGISAHASEKDAERGIIVGMSRFISKPVKLNILKEIVVSDEVLSASAKLEELSINNEISDTGVQEMKNNEDNSVKGSQSDGCDENSSSWSKVEQSPGLVCLLAHSSLASRRAISKYVESKGYRVCSVDNGEDALRLLKIRNWDVVLLDELLPLKTGTSCVVCFRTWERSNRVARQSNVYLLSRSFISYREGLSHCTYPTGFDGALGKPVQLTHLYDLLDRAANGKTVEREILTR